MKSVPTAVLSLLAVLSLGVPLVALAAQPRAALAPAEQEFTRTMQLPADRDEGRRLYGNCAACHGDSGAGSSSALVPRIAGQHYSVIVRQLVDYRHARRVNDRMQAATGDHLLPGAQAIANVATYVNLLKIAGPANKGTGLLTEEGRAVFEANCAACHGVAAQGSDGQMIPRLAGQNYAYLVRQFGDIARGRRPNASPQHVELLQRLQYQEMVSLADYLSALL